MQYIDLKKAIYGESDEDDWTCEFSESPEDAKELIEADFHYVTDMDDQKLFRKPK